MSRSEEARQIVDTIEGAGVRVPPTCRIATMAKAMTIGPDELSPVISPDDPRFEAARQGLRDLTEWNFICKHLAGRMAELEIAQRLRIAMKDAVNPDDSTGHTPGRDAQFELFVGAMMQSGRMAPTFESKGADFTVSFEGLVYTIETKRIKMLRRLEQRFREACDQVRTSQRPGIVFMDISEAVRDGTHFTGSATDEQIARALQGRGRALVAGPLRNLLEWRRDADVRGLMLVDHLTIFEPELERRPPGGDGWTPHSFHSFYPLVPRPLCLPITKLADRIRSGLPNLIMT